MFKKTFLGLIVLLVIFLMRGTAPCIKSGNTRLITAALKKADTKIKLCQKAVFEISEPLSFEKRNQLLFTDGYPTDNRRATVRIVGKDISLAINAYQSENAQVKNIIVDGNRRELGHFKSHGLIMMGGNVTKQEISGIKAFDSRSWTTIHVNWGDMYKDDFGKIRSKCSGVIVRDSQIGPSGEAEKGKWSDGISVQCEKTTVKNNSITGVTDGGIILFGAPGSNISGNRISSGTRGMMLGIGMVDYHDYKGNYDGVVVQNNTVTSSKGYTTVGIAMGSRVWHCPLSGFTTLNQGATIRNNFLFGDNFGYGYAVNGVRDWIVGNNHAEAKFSGTASTSCGTQNAAPQPFVIEKEFSIGIFQPEFIEGKLDKIYDLRPL